jgi:hypothetical protein
MGERMCDDLSSADLALARRPEEGEMWARVVARGFTELEQPPSEFVDMIRHAIGKATPRPRALMMGSRC